MINHWTSSERLKFILRWPRLLVTHSVEKRKKRIKTLIFSHALPRKAYKDSARTSARNIRTQHDNHNCSTWYVTKVYTCSCTCTCTVLCTRDYDSGTTKVHRGTKMAEKTLFLCLNFKNFQRTTQKNAEHNTRVRNMPALGTKHMLWE